MESGQGQWADEWVGVTGVVSWMSRHWPEGEGMWEVGLQEAGAGECGMGVEVEHETLGVCRMGASIMRAMVVSRGSPIPRIKPGGMLSSI